MKKIHRLQKNKQILITIRANNKSCSSVANLYFKKNSSQYWKLAIVVSKKNFKLSVTRNRIKRQVRALVTDLLTDCKSYDLVLIIKPPWLTKTFQEKKLILKNLFNKLEGGSNGQKRKSCNSTNVC